MDKGSASGAASGSRWGELDDNVGASSGAIALGKDSFYDENGDLLPLPEREVIGPDAKGIKTVVDYSYDDLDRRVKTIRKYEVIKQKVRVPRVVAERKQWKRFGKAENAEENAHLTFLSKDPVRIDLPGEEAENAKKEQELLIQRLAQKQRERAEKKLLEENFINPSISATTSSMSTSDASAASKPGSYVPPALRKAREQGTSENNEETTTTIKISNLSEQATEDDVFNLVRPFGPVQRPIRVTDRETQRSRGYAYVTFVRRADAERAKEVLHGRGYDHLILKVDWAQTFSKDIGSQNVLRAGIVSGYGKALPQG